MIAKDDGTNRLIKTPQSFLLLKLFSLRDTISQSIPMRCFQACIAERFEWVLSCHALHQDNSRLKLYSGQPKWTISVLLRSQRISDLVSKTTCNVFDSISGSIDFGSRQSARETELIWHPFNTMSGVDVFDEGDLIARSRALT